MGLPIDYVEEQPQGPPPADALPASPAISQILVDMADMKTSNSPGAKLRSSMLGSCVAVAIYDPVACVGGLLQFILPESSIFRERALVNPYLFADTGIPLLFRCTYKLGAVKERIICRLIGGADVFDKSQLYQLGTRNSASARRVLTTNNVQIAGEHLGGIAGRTMTMYMDTGRVVVTTPLGADVEL